MRVADGDLVDVQQRQTPDGRVIDAIIVRAVRSAFGRGALDDVMRQFGTTRRGTPR